jgi:hypothetical protein
MARAGGDLLPAELSLRVGVRLYAFALEINRQPIFRPQRVRDPGAVASCEPDLLHAVVEGEVACHAAR